MFLVETSHCGVSEYIRKCIRIQKPTAINPADGRHHNVTSLLRMMFRKLSRLGHIDAIPGLGICAKR